MGRIARGTFAVVLVLPLILAAMAWSGGGRPHSLSVALVVTGVFIAAVLIGLELLGRADPNPVRGEYGYSVVTLGVDGRVSTSKFTAALWSLVFAASLVFLCAFYVGQHSMTVEQVFGVGSDWDSYFLLLGGPFAAAVLAKAITADKEKKTPGTKSLTAAAEGVQANGDAPTPGSKPATSVKDVVRDDNGTLSLIDTQYALFSLVAILYFVSQMISNVTWYANAAQDVRAAAPIAIGLPAIPSALIGLLTIAAGTYVGNKAVQATTSPDTAANSNQS